MSIHSKTILITEAAKALGYICRNKLIDIRDGSQVYVKSYLSMGKVVTDKIKIYRDMVVAQKYINLDSHLPHDQGGVFEFITNRLDFFYGNIEKTEIPEMVLSVLEMLSNQVYDLDWCYQRKCQVIPNRKPFDNGSWLECSLTTEDTHFFYNTYHLTSYTVSYFLPFIRKVSCNDWPNGITHYGFPYESIQSKEVVGYEMRNYNFEAAFVFSENKKGYWIATGASLPSQVKEIYLFETAMNAMAYFDLTYKQHEYSDSAFIAIGDYQRKSEILSVFARYPMAKIFTCFPNEFCGNLFDIQIACMKVKKDFSYHTNKGKVIFKVGNSVFEFWESDFTLNHFEKVTGLRSNIRKQRPKNAVSYMDALLKSSSPKHSL